jgi:hypothetical protein
MVVALTYKVVNELGDVKLEDVTIYLAVQRDEWSKLSRVLVFDAKIDVYTKVP